MFTCPSPSPTARHHHPAPPSITRIWSTHVNGTSFCIYWSSGSETNQTYQVALSDGSGVIQHWETGQTMVKVSGLRPGVLYHATVTPFACGGQGNTLHMSVRTGKNCGQKRSWLFPSLWFLVSLYTVQYTKLQFVYRVAERWQFIRYMKSLRTWLKIFVLVILQFVLKKSQWHVEATDSAYTYTDTCVCIENLALMPLYFSGERITTYDPSIHPSIICTHYMYTA